MTGAGLQLDDSTMFRHRTPRRNADSRLMEMVLVETVLDMHREGALRLPSDEIAGGRRARRGGQPPSGPRADRTRARGLLTGGRGADRTGAHGRLPGGRRAGPTRAHGRLPAAVPLATDTSPCPPVAA